MIIVTRDIVNVCHRRVPVAEVYWTVSGVVHIALYNILDVKSEPCPQARTTSNTPPWLWYHNLRSEPTMTGRTHMD